MEQSLGEFEFSKWLVDQDLTTCKHESTYKDFCMICKKTLQEHEYRK